MDRRSTRPSNLRILGNTCNNPSPPRGASWYYMCLPDVCRSTFRPGCGAGQLVPMVSQVSCSLSTMMSRNTGHRRRGQSLSWRAFVPIETWLLTSYAAYSMSIARMSDQCVRGGSSWQVKGVVDVIACSSRTEFFRRSHTRSWTGPSLSTLGLL